MNLKKKIGPLPLWAWILIVGTAGGLLWYEHGKSSSSSSSTSTNQNAVDPNSPLGLTYAQESADEAQGIDPTTGQTYASEQALADGGGGEAGLGDGDYGGGTGLTDSSGTTTVAPGETLTDEANDLLSAQQALQALGLIPANSTATPAPAVTAPAAAAPAKQSVVEKLKDGITVTNSKIVPKGDVLEGIGGGFYEDIPKTTIAQKAVIPKTQITAAEKKIVSTEKKS